MNSPNHPQPTQTPRFRLKESWLLTMAVCLMVVCATPSIARWLREREPAPQTLPSPYYLVDDVQCYAPGSEFKLAPEAAWSHASVAEDATSSRDGLTVAGDPKAPSRD